MMLLKLNYSYMGRQVLPLFRNAGILHAKNADRDVRVPSNDKAGLMRKTLFAIIFILSSLCINATIREVSLDGSHEYTSIQDAIDDSYNSDTILVHSGVYLENIEFAGKSITVTSNYMYNDDWSTVESTIIDGGQLSTCILVKEHENAILNGFTITNGIGYSTSRFGGGVFIKSASTLTLSNCLVENNNGFYGGGIVCGSDCTLNISGCTVRNNVGVYWGGGIGGYQCSIWFDPVNLNNIYNNYGDVLDISLFDTICNNICLDTLSIDLDTPDGYIVSFESTEGLLAPTITVMNSIINQVDANLYVSPTGDNLNDGLTPETALQSIACATRLIKPNEDNPNTVFILPGVYSKELNNQIFPIALQSNTKMLGLGSENSDVLLGDEWDLNTLAVYYQENVKISNLSSYHNNTKSPSLFISNSSNVCISDLDFGSSLAQYPGISISFSENINISNCIIHDNVTSLLDFTCLSIYLSYNVILSNIVICNNDSNSRNGWISGLNLDDSDVTANNIVVANNHQDYPGTLVQYANTAMDSPGGNLELKNFLMYNNISSHNGTVLTIFGSNFDPCYVNNMTYANNAMYGGMLRVFGEFSIHNSIMYNPNSYGEMYIFVRDKYVPTQRSIVNVDYCLIRNGYEGIGGTSSNNAVLNWGAHNIDADPLFRGDVYGDVELNDIAWVQLTQGSPCINAGTPDTLDMNLPSVDIAGNPRVWDGIIDMGAYEYNPTPNSDETSPTPPATIQVSHFPNPVTPNSNDGKIAFIEFTLPKKPIEKPTLEIYNIR